MREYWKHIHQQALREVREELRIETGVRLVLVIIAGVLAIASLAVVGSEGAATDEITIRAVAASVIILALPFVYIWKFCSLPPRLHKEIEDENKTLKAHLIPRLVFIFDPNDPACVRTDVVIHDDERGDEVVFNYCVGITNNSGETVRDVSVKLVNLGKTQSSILPKTLKPRDHDTEKFDLRPHDTEYVHVARSSNHPDVNGVVLRYFDTSVPNIIPHGKYRIKLKAYGDGVMPENHFFVLKSDKSGSLEFGPWGKKESDREF